MKPETEAPLPSEQECFDLLERPELWPEDPELQAELAALLELHLALKSHGAELASDARPRQHSRGRSWSLHSSWMLAAAAALIAVLPGVYVVRHTQYLKNQARDRAHIEAVAQRRGQDRLWMAFFQQSSELLRQFEQDPAVCAPEKENRNPERELAAALLQASHQLASQGAPNSDAEITRTNLHAWLTELFLEEGCMEPGRAEELRQWAATHNLGDESKRLGRLLKGEAQ